MREIKFRAWNSNINVMIKDISKDPYCPMEHYLDEKYSFKVMQFTGLHDKNGVEIYEGDIIKFECIEVEIHPIVFSKGAFCPEGWVHDTLLKNNIEIIGNIYENPELIKAGAK